MRKTQAVALSLLMGAGLAAFVLAGQGFGQTPAIERASVASTGEEADATSVFPALSAGGRYVAFASDATNLANNAFGRNIFVHDRQTGATEVASVSNGGTPANSLSLFTSISGDGRYVVFSSDASTLVPNDMNGSTDVFVRDRVAGTTTLVSVASDGTQGDAESTTPSISANGRYVAFTSLASNLVDGDTNNDRDVFVRDLADGTTELASQATDGTRGDLTSGGLGGGPPKISADGQYVVFGSFASTLVPGDTNARDDIFVRDRVAGTTDLVSVASDGTQGNGHSMYGSISDNGRYVTFFADASNLVPNDTNGATDVFLRDRVMHTTTLVSRGLLGLPAEGPSQFGVISGDGSIIAFQSAATNLVAGDSNNALDMFLYHRADGRIERASVPNGGGEANLSSSFGSLSTDGTALAFQSDATNLAANDGNKTTDIFVRGKSLVPPPTPTPTVTSTPTPRRPAGDVNGDGRVDSIDAALILQYSAGLLPSISPAGDVNRDGRVDAVDAALILQYSAGLLNRLPP